MEMYGKILILGGFAIVILAQLVASIISFRVSVADGVLSLFVPGYLLFAMRKAGHYWSFFAAWGSGILGVVVGTIMLS